MLPTWKCSKPRPSLRQLARKAIDIAVARSQYEHAQLAVLIGKPPASFSLAPLPLTMASSADSSGLASELLERRPDIAAAERLMASANAQIGVAKSAYYPLVNLAAVEALKVALRQRCSPAPAFCVGRPSALFTIFDVGSGALPQIRPSLRTIRPSPIIAKRC